jgi:hypothetical protein
MQDRWLAGALALMPALGGGIAGAAAQEQSRYPNLYGRAGRPD